MKIYNNTFEVNFIAITNSKERVLIISNQIKEWINDINIGLKIVDEKNNFDSSNNPAIYLFFKHEEYKHLISFTIRTRENSPYEIYITYGIVASSDYNITGTPNGYYYIGVNKISDYSFTIISDENAIILCSSLKPDFNNSVMFLKSYDINKKEYIFFKQNNGYKYVYMDEILEENLRFSFFLTDLPYQYVQWNGHCFLFPCFLYNNQDSSWIQNQMIYKVYNKIKYATGKSFSVGKTYKIGNKKYYCLGNTNYTNIMVLLD